MLNGTGASTVRNNFISGNTATVRRGGIGSIQPSGDAIVQNVIIGNSAPDAGGVHIRVPSGYAGFVLVNNTLSENQATASAQTTASNMKVTGSGDQVQFINNIFAGPAGHPAVICETAPSPVFRSNDLYADGSPPSAGCSGTTGDGNISADPGFSAGAYHLMVGSPAMDAGDNGAPSLSPSDIDGEPRVVGAAIDQGADEFPDMIVPGTVVPTQLSVGDASVSEGTAGSTPVAVTIVRAGDNSGSSSVQVRTPAGTATPGVDYHALPVTMVSFSPGDTTKTITVAVTGETLAEANETFHVSLSNVTGAEIAGVVGTVTVVNDDVAAYLAVDDPSVTRPTRASRRPLSRSPEPATSRAPRRCGTDYNAVPVGELVFGPGETTKTVSVDVVGDTDVEPNETLNLTLSSVPGGTVLSDASGSATIVDDDGSVTAAAPATFFSVSDAWMLEGDSGTAPVTFSIVRSGDTSASSTVQVKTSGGGATPGIDYGPVALTEIDFGRGEAVKTVAVDVIGETLPELNQTFNLALSGASGAEIADAAGTATIVNDDGAAYLAVNNITIVEGNSGIRTGAFTVTRSGNTSGSSTVSYGISGTATPSGSTTDAPDYQASRGSSLAFAPGETVKTVTVYVFGDTAPEADETLNLTLSGRSRPRFPTPRAAARFSTTTDPVTGST